MTAITCSLCSADHYSKCFDASVTAREANQAFSRILKAAEGGESVVITRRGEPVAIVAPYRTRDREREQAIERVIAMMRKGLPIGGCPFSRDEMHER